MPLDPTTVYQNSKGAEPFNPLTTIGKFAEIGNALQSNRLMKQKEQFAAQTNPLDVQQKQAQLAMQHIDNAGKIIAPLLNQEVITGADVMKSMHDAREIGALDEKTYNTMLKSWGSFSPENNKQNVLKYASMLADAKGRIETSLGPAAQVNLGDRIAFGRTGGVASANPGMFNAENEAATGLSPEAKAQRVSSISTEGPTKGQPITQPQSALVDREGFTLNASADPLEKELQDSVSGVAPAEEHIPTGGKVVPNKAPAGALVTGFSPGEADSMARASEEGDMLRKSADAVPNRRALLDEMDALVKSGDVNFGPGSEKWKGVLSGVQRLYGGDSKTVASYDTFNKLATQLAQQQFQSLGGTGTDIKLGSAISASPNTALSNRSNEQIIALLKGNEDAIAVKNREWNEYKKAYGAGSYGDFSTLFNKHFDPRVFQAPHMAATEKKAMLDSLSDKEFDQYKKDYEFASKNGWLKK